MNTEPQTTEFASPERVDLATVRRQHDMWRASALDHPLVQLLLDALSTGLVVVNATRQIVFANGTAEDFFGMAMSELLGTRAGEALRCRNAADSPGGCGTAYPCRYCGLIKAILDAEDFGQRFDCRMLKDNGTAIDLGVSATRFSLASERFVVLTLEDISSEKRREALERVFFHDVLNTLNVLQMGIEVSLDELPEDKGTMLLGATRRIVREVRGQRSLMEAERGALSVLPTEEDVSKVAKDICDELAVIPEADGITIHAGEVPAGIRMQTDKGLLGRVLTNLLKNAVEASATGDTVSVGCTQNDTRTLFWVRNPAVMDRSTRSQVFHRSFSTKGAGRGLGTYGVKLLVERYLKGKVGFQSSEDGGTVFFIDLPNIYPRLPIV